MTFINIPHTNCHYLRCYNAAFLCHCLYNSSTLRWACWYANMSPSDKTLVDSLCILTKVKPLFTLLHRGSDSSPLLFVFSANYIDRSNRNFICLNVFRIYPRRPLRPLELMFFIFIYCGCHIYYIYWLQILDFSHRSSRFSNQWKDSCRWRRHPKSNLRGSGGQSERNRFLERER